MSATTNVKFYAATIRQGGLVKQSQVIYRASLTKQAAISKSATYKWSATANVLKVLNVILDATVKFAATAAREGSVVLAATYSWTASVARAIALEAAALYRWGASATVTFIGAGGGVIVQLTLDATYKFAAVSDDFLRAFVKAFSGHAGLGLLFRRRRRNTIKRAR